MNNKYFAIILGLLCSAPAFAAHPLITDDSGTQGKGKFQVELNGEYSKNEANTAGMAQSETGGTIAAAVTYGLIDNVDIIVGFPWQWSSLKENGSIISDNNGVGDTSVDVKWRFLEGKPHELSLALKPGMTIPSGDETKGFGDGRISGGVMLIGTKEWQNVTFHCNAGYTHHAYGQIMASEMLKQDILHASLAAEFSITNNLRTVGNIGIETNENKASDNHPVFLLGGMIFSAADNFDLDLGVKGGLNKAETDTTILAGLSARF